MCGIPQNHKEVMYYTLHFLDSFWILFLWPGDGQLQLKRVVIE